MAFNAQNMTQVTNVNASGPALFLYYTATDTAATVSGATYFRPFGATSALQYIPFSFSVGDVIQCNCSDGLVTVTVTSINPITTTFTPTDIAPGTIVNADINAAAAIAFSKLAALTSGNILVGSAGNVPTSVAMSGDATIIASGALTIANDAITTAKILNANVTLAKLASGITPSHVVKFAGQPTTVGGAAAEAFAIAGVAATDLAFVQIVNDGTSNVTVLQAVCTLNTLTVTFSANPGNDTVFNYQILRAAA